VHGQQIVNRLRRLTLSEEYMTRPRWSVIVPAYNEAERLPRSLEDIVACFEGRGEAWEALVVDDGSTDDTPRIVAAVARVQPAVRLIQLAGNHGKGAAVRRGMLEARGEYRLFTDADGATPIAELKRLEPALAAGADIAIGSRVVVDPAVSVTAQPHRVLAGRVFNWLVSHAGLRGIADSQCGFKAFKARAAEDLFAPLRTRGFGFDVELLLQAQARGYRIAEVPVNWVDQAGSKVGVLKDGPLMLAQILAARLRLARGR
jgi:dolichyl-phosphate beta-glucosyltransferase